MNRNQYWKIAAVSAAALVLFSGCSIFPEEEEALAPPLVKPAEVKYETADAVSGTISEIIEDNCTVVATNQYSLSFPQSGVLISKEVNVGDTVKKGQVLAKLDCGDAEAQLADAQISLKMQEVYLEQALSAGLPDTDTKGNKVNFAAQIAQLQIDQIKLKIENLNKAVSNATVYAPVDGVVTFMIDTAVGESVQKGVSVCQVSDPVQLSFEYVGGKASKLKLGAEAILTIDGKEYIGKISVTQDSVPKEFKNDYKNRVQIKLDNLPSVTVGATVKFKVQASEKENAVIVPRSAVTGYTGSYYVKVYDEGLVEERSVEIGIMNSGQIEILSGVSAGEKVVVQ